MKKRLERFNRAITELIINYLNSKGWTSIDETTKQLLKDPTELRRYVEKYATDRKTHLLFYSMCKPHCDYKFITRRLITTS